MPKQGLVEIIAVLDRSGSMYSITDDVIGGFNRFIEDQKQISKETLVTLILSDDEYIIVYAKCPISDVPLLTPAVYVPRGWTALLDAIGHTIDTIGERLSTTPEPERPEKIIIVTMTDGLENSSRDYIRSQVFEKIKEQREVYSWEFLFLGAKQDAISEGGKLSIDQTHSASYAQTTTEVGVVLKNLDASVERARVGQPD